MSESQATWSADGSHIPDINPHTKAKHQIIETYLENLICTLYGKSRRGETTFTFVDGFCGGGMYYDQDNKTEWQGSPIRIITDSIRHKKSWAEYFKRQWNDIETAAREVGCEDRLHIWPDPELRGLVDDVKLDYWLYKPTVEKWDSLTSLKK